MSQYISVADFSRKINESKTKAYTIIENSIYKDYVKIINGTKMVSVDLINVYLNGSAEPLKDNDNEINSNNNQKEIKDNVDYKYLIDIQNNRIKELERQIVEKDKVILDYANKFAEMATQAQSIAVSALNTTGQAQYLQATQQMEKQNVNEPVEDFRPVEKKTFWQRIFGK